MEKTPLKHQVAEFAQSLRAIDNLYEQYARSVGLTYIGLGVLEAIYSTGPCTQKSICEHIRMPKQTVNVVIHSFLEKGYLEMKELEADRRNKAIQLTKAGQEYAHEIVGRLYQAEEQAMGRLTPAQRQGILGLAEKIEQSFRQNLQLE